jgi:Rrf2 family protein
MISTTARYALNIVGYLVSHRGSRVRGEQIAEDTGIPANYLSKILNQLRKHGIVDAEKGWGGGFQVRKEVLRRPIREIVLVIDGSRNEELRKACLYGLRGCTPDNPCPLHPYWERIKDAETDMLMNKKIQDLAQ